MINKKIIKTILKMDVELVAATKYADRNQIMEMISSGVKTIGESKVQDSVEKRIIELDCKKHFIGHLQSNKVGKVVEIFDLIQSVDSLKLAKEINKRSLKIMPIFIQVNIAKEESKFGFMPKDITKVVDEINKLPKIKVEGIMVMPPIGSREHFKQAKEIQKALKLKELSMGTSDDYKIAIEEGATMIRLGRVLYEM